MGFSSVCTLYSLVSLIRTTEVREILLYSNFTIVTLKYLIEDTIFRREAL